MVTRQPIITLRVCVLVSHPVLIHIHVLWVLISLICVQPCGFLCVLTLWPYSYWKHLLPFIRYLDTISSFQLVCVWERDDGIATLFKSVPNVFCSDHLLLSRSASVLLFLFLCLSLPLPLLSLSLFLSLWCVLQKLGPHSFILKTSPLLSLVESQVQS